MDKISNLVYDQLILNTGDILSNKPVTITNIPTCQFFAYKWETDYKRDRESKQGM